MNTDERLAKKMQRATQAMCEADESPIWYGDLADDCCSKWRGLLLRAELMYGKGSDVRWWWAVSSIETGEQVDSSNSHSHSPTSCDDARKSAEAAARRYYEKIYSSLFRHNL